MKNTYYFSHDYNAREDEKIMFLLSKHKWEGYGIYWLLIELLHEASNNKLNTDLLDGIAFRNNIDITVLRSVISTGIETNLFYQKDNKLGSKRVDINVKELDDFRQKKSLAGKKGMAKRWGKDNTVITKHNKGKEKKVKESKVNNIGANAQIIPNITLNGEPMTYEELNDDEIVYETLDNKTPKKYKNKRKLYSRTVVYYMELLNKSGNALKFFPAMKEIFDLYVKEFPNDSEEEIEKEIKGRIDLANWHYNKINCKGWGLSKIAEEWNNIWEWKKEKDKYN